MYSIVKAVSNKTTEKEIILIKLDGKIYFWLVENGHIYMGIENNSNIEFKIQFSQEHFNDFIFILSQLILPILTFEDETFQLLELVTATISDTELIQLTSLANCQQILKKYEFSFKMDSLIYLLYYKDILVVVSKLRTMHNPKIKENILKSCIYPHNN